MHGDGIPLMLAQRQQRKPLHMASRNWVPQGCLLLPLLISHLMPVPFGNLLSCPTASMEPLHTCPNRLPAVSTNQVPVPAS